MANPQLEDGYIKIANELYQALYRVSLSGSEFQIVGFVIYQTYGYNRKTRRMSASYIAKGTNMPVKTVRRCLKQLINNKIIIARGVSNSAKSYGINKNYEKWVLKNKEGVLNFGEGVLKNGDTQKCDYSKMGTRGTQKWAPGVLKNEYQYNTEVTIQNKQYRSSSTTATAEPKIEDVFSYCQKKGYTFDCNKFFYHYQSLGWTYKGQPIANWKALADRWQATENKSADKSQSSKSESETSYDLDEYEKYSMFDEV